MNKILLIAGTSLLFICFSFRSTKKENKNTAVTDVICAEHIATNQRFIIETAKLAQKKALRSSIRDFADILIKENQTTTMQLLAQATDNGFAVTGDLSEDQISAYEKLRGLALYDFDKEFTRLVLKSNKEILHQYTREFKKGEYPEMRYWAFKKILVMDDVVHVSKVCHYIARNQ
jgi:predicted outer membrane protein